MSVKVNLLPREVGQRSRAGRQRALAGLAFGVLLLGVGGAWYYNQGRIDDAEADLADAEQQVALLQGELGELAPFAELQAEQAAGEALLTSALGDEVTVAGVLQDLSSVFPPNAELNDLAVVVSGDRAPQAGGERLVVGSVTGNGSLLLGVAPGAERFLIDVGRSAAFENVFITTEVDDGSANVFTFDLELGPEVLTGRYGNDDAAATTPATTEEVQP